MESLSSSNVIILLKLFRKGGSRTQSQSTYSEPCVASCHTSSVAQWREAPWPKWHEGPPIEKMSHANTDTKSLLFPHGRSPVNRSPENKRFQPTSQAIWLIELCRESWRSLKAISSFMSPTLYVLSTIFRIILRAVRDSRRRKTGVRVHTPLTRFFDLALE